MEQGQPEKKNHVVGVRLSDRDLRKLNRLIKEWNVSAAEVFRRLLRKQKP